MLGNLRSVTLPDGRLIEYVIDASNRRVGKKVNGTLVAGWIYADQLRIVAETDGSGTVTKRFVYGTRSNVPDYMLWQGGTYRIIADQFGSPRYVLQATAGTLAQSISYDEFGNVLSDTNPGFTPFGFAGGLYDRDTRLVRFGARDYEARTGRWTTKDPISFVAGDTNLYAYVGNDPITFVDPSGLSGTIAIFSTTDQKEGSSMDIQAGHSWISYTPDNPASSSGQDTTTQYSTWSGLNTRGVAAGLNQDIEDALGEYQPTSARFAHIDDAAEARLKAVIARYRKSGWSFSEPCSGFAHDAWLAATGEDLHQSYAGQSNPTSLNKGIVKANHGKPFFGLKPIKEARTVYINQLVCRSRGAHGKGN